MRRWIALLTCKHVVCGPREAWRPELEVPAAARPQWPHAPYQPPTPVAPLPAPAKGVDYCVDEHPPEEHFLCAFCREAGADPLVGVIDVVTAAPLRGPNGRY